MEIPNSDTYYVENKRMERSMQGNLPEDTTSELRPELHHGISSKIWDKNSEAVGCSKCKCPKAGASLASSRDNASGTGTKDGTDPARLCHNDLLPKHVVPGKLWKRFWILL